MQKIIHPFDRQNANITSKTYQTRLDRPTVIRKANNLTTTAEITNKQTNQWNPIRIQDYLQDSEDDVIKIPISLTSPTVTNSNTQTNTNGLNRSHYEEL